MPQPSFLPSLNPCAFFCFSSLPRRANFESRFGASFWGSLTTQPVDTFFTSSFSPIVNRESLFTGKTAPRCAFGSEATHQSPPRLNPNHQVFTELLQKAGYRTGLFGRWYLCKWLPSSPLSFQTSLLSNKNSSVLPCKCSRSPHSSWI